MSDTVKKETEISQAIKQIESTLEKLDEFKLKEDEIKSTEDALSKMSETFKESIELQRDLLVLQNQCWVYEPMALENSPEAVKEHCLFFGMAPMAGESAQQLSDHVTRLGKYAERAKRERVRDMLRHMIEDLDTKVSALEERYNK